LLLQIRLGVRYLKDVLKMKFPELRARAAAAEAEARAREVAWCLCAMHSADVAMAKDLAVHCTLADFLEHLKI